MELGFGFAWWWWWGGCVILGRVPSWFRLEGTPGAKVGMGARSTQVVVPSSRSHTRAPLPSPSGSFCTSRTPPLPTPPPRPRAAKLARCAGQHPALPAGRPWLGSPTPPLCPPIPRLRRVLPFLRRGAGLSSNGRVTEIGARTPLPGDPTPDRGRWRGGGRVGSAEGQREPGGRMEAKTGSPLPRPTPASGGRGQAGLGPCGAGQALLVPPHRPSEPGS